MSLQLTPDEIETSLLKFIELIRFPTISNSAVVNGSYQACGTWLLNQLKEIGLHSFILEESLENKPIVIATWEGSDPSLPCLLLNSHYDVVPVVLDKWTVPAFDGLRQNGKIYGRGTQDMKCVCMQYITAIAKLKSLGDFKPIRTIHLSFIPDEEIGGIDGMNILLTSDWFASVKLELALDEGLANESNDMSIFYGERLPWWVKITAQGNTGHASRFIDGTAVEQLLAVTSKAMEFRKEQKDILHGVNQHAGCSHAVAVKKKATLGDVTSMNITMLRSGVQANGEDIVNVIPPTAEAGFDIRISPNMETSEMLSKLDLWCEEVTRNTPGLNKKEGHGVSWSFVRDPLYSHNITSTDPAVNQWYALFEQTLLTQHNIKLVPEVFPAATDSRFLRALGYKAFGFSPMRNIRIMLHENDEFIEEAVYAEGCQVYVTLIRALSMQGSFV